jgi:hypothetical protein
MRAVVFILQALGDETRLLFSCVKGGATRPGYFFPAPVEALGDETRFLFFLSR